MGLCWPFGGWIGGLISCLAVAMITNAASIDCGDGFSVWNRGLGGNIWHAIYGRGVLHRTHVEGFVTGRV